MGLSVPIGLFVDGITFCSKFTVGVEAAGRRLLGGAMTGVGLLDKIDRGLP
jgi:hypothetical protein